MSELHITPATMTLDELDRILFDHFKPEKTVECNAVFWLYGDHATARWTPSRQWDDCVPLIEVAWKEYGLRPAFYLDDGDDWSATLEEPETDTAVVWQSARTLPEAAARALVELILRKEIK